uniref:Uncharacterized protein n=1 Tax=Arundo donax TaxID=35708 RepID=A0A0A9A0T7_ARUDO
MAVDGTAPGDDGVPDVGTVAVGGDVEA